MAVPVSQRMLTRLQELSRRTKRSVDELAQEALELGLQELEGRGRRYQDARNLRELCDALNRVLPGVPAPGTIPSWGEPPEFEATSWDEESVILFLFDGEVLGELEGPAYYIAPRAS